MDRVNQRMLVWFLGLIALTSGRITAEIEPRGAFPATQVNHTENIATPTSDAVKADDAVLTLEATLVFNGLKLDIVLPAGQLTSTLAEEVCATAFLTAFGGDKVACVEECRNQISRRRSAQMLYRRWVNKKHLMAFPIPQHMSTAEGVKVIADAEIRNMRYGGKWKTKTPTNADPYSEPYWAAVQRLETALERRGYMVYDGHIAHCPQKVKMFLDVCKDSPSIQTICEIGFNAGHSALVWLATLPHTRVLSFDLGTHPYLETAATIINEMYPGRLSVVLGDSLHTVPKYLAEHPGFQCNVLFVDGSHDYEPVLADLRHFRDFANQTFGHVLLVDDFGCVEPYCRHVRTAFYKMVHDLEIMERKIITTEEYTHLVGGGETPVVNGMAAALYLDQSDSRRYARPNPDWVPFSTVW